MRPSWNLVNKLLVWGFDVAIALDRWRERRKKRKRQPTVGESLREHRERMNARTVIIPRRDR